MGRKVQGRPMIAYHNFTLTVLSSDHISGLSTISDSAGLNCAYHWDLTRVVAPPPATRLPTRTPTRTATPTATLNPNAFIG